MHKKYKSLKKFNKLSMQYRKTNTEQMINIFQINNFFVLNCLNYLKILKIFINFTLSIDLNHLQYKLDTNHCKHRKYQQKNFQKRNLCMSSHNYLIIKTFQTHKRYNLLMKLNKIGTKNRMANTEQKINNYQLNNFKYL